VARVLPTPPSTRFTLGGRSWRWLALVVVAIVSVVVLAHVLSGPHFVPTLTVANPTEYSIEVTLSNQGDNTMPLATVSPGTTAQLRDVVDQGSVWKFSLRAQGRDAGDVFLTRDELRSQRWQMEIPSWVAGRLHQLGVMPGSLP
jgi:hypothetical protein